MSSEDIVEKMEEYSQFVTQKLRPELERAEKSRDETRREMKEYDDLFQRLTGFKKEAIKEINTVVDLGHGTLFCNARGELDSIYVHVGMGFHVQMTIAEAIPFVKRRLTFLETNVLKRKEAQVREITDHIVTASTILDELTQQVHRD